MSGIWRCFAPTVFSPWPFFAGGPVFFGWAEPEAPSQPRISRGASSSARAAQSLLTANNGPASCHWKCRNFPQVVEHVVTFQHVFRLCLTFWGAQNMELNPRKPAEERWSSNWRPLRGRNPVSEEEPTEPCGRCCKRPPHAWLGPHPLLSLGLRTKGKAGVGERKRGTREAGIFPCQQWWRVPRSVDRGGHEPTPDRRLRDPGLRSESSKWRLRRQVSSTLFWGLREGLMEEGVYQENMDSLLVKGMGTEGTRFGVWPWGDQIYTHHSGRSWKIVVVFRLRCDAIGWPFMGVSG